MRREWAAVTILMGLAITGGTAGAQGVLRGATTAPATAPGEGLAVKNIEKQLENLVTIDAEKTTLAEFIDSLRKITQTNITVNWNALAAAGLARETPVTLHLKGVPYEQVVKTLIDTLPVKDNDPALRLNYVVGDNTLSITTNAELGKGAVPRVYTFTPPAALPGGQRDDASRAEHIVKAYLLRAGEPMKAPGHAVAMKGDTLVASVSERGHTLINKVKASLAVPTRPGIQPPGIALTAAGKRGQDTLARVSGVPGGKVTPEWIAALAKDPQKYVKQGLNVAMLSTAAPATTTAPAEGGGGAEPAAAAGGGGADLGCTINDGGVLLIGPKTALQARIVFAAFDLRDVLRKQAGPPNAGPRGNARGAAPAPPQPSGPEILTKTLDALKGKVTPEGGWGDLDTPGAAALAPYGTTLVVLAPADVQRQVSTALAELGR
jgi:hypothetical protein